MTNALFLQGLNNGGQVVISSATNHTVDASNEGLAFAFFSETADPITAVFVRYGARTGTPPTYRVSLQSTSATGNPDGTVLGGGSPASGTFTPPADATWDGTGQWITLANAYTPTLGQLLFLVVDYSSGTIDVSNNSSFSRLLTGMSVGAAGIPYSLTNTGGVWTKLSSAFVYGYRTASRRYGYPGVSATATTVSTVGHRSTAGITLPSGLGTTFSPIGIMMTGRLAATSHTAKMGVWNTAGTLLAETLTFDADAQGNITNTATWRGIFTTPPTLNYGTKYYYGAEVTSGSVIGVHGLQLSAAEDRQAFPLGENRLFATWNGSAWTETTTILPLVDLIFNDITVPAGGGGLLIHPGMSGGMG